MFRTYKQRISEDFLEHGNRLFTFDQDYAFENKDVDYVNIYNPIVIAASVYFKEAISSIGNTFQLKYKLPEGMALNRGEYFMAIYTVKTQREILGKKVCSETLVPVLYDVTGDYTITDADLNLKVFGEIQDNAFNVTADDGQLNMADERYSNMESDFTLYISEYITDMKEDMAIRDESQKELFIRQLNEYFAARIDKEKKNITDAEFNIEWISDNMKRKESGKEHS